MPWFWCEFFQRDRYFLVCAQRPGIMLFSDWCYQKCSAKKSVDLSNGGGTGVVNTSKNTGHQDSLSNRTYACIKGTYIVRCSYHLTHQAELLRTVVPLLRKWPVLIWSTIKPILMKNLRVRRDKRLSWWSSWIWWI